METFQSITRPAATRLGLMVSLMSLAVILVSAGPARADCSVLDITCTVDREVETASETVEDTTSAGGVDASTPADPVEDTAEAATQAVEAAASTATETVKGAVGAKALATPVDDPVMPLPGEEPVPGHSDDPRPGAGSDPGNGRGAVSGGESESASPVSPESTGASRTGSAGSAATVVLGPATAAFAGSGRPFPSGLFDGFGGRAAEVARTLAFPFVLVLLVAAFIAVQNRIDNRDPKLALATVEPDLVEFE